MTPRGGVRGRLAGRVTLHATLCLHYSRRVLVCLQDVWIVVAAMLT
jgi:hypothetical protein